MTFEEDVIYKTIQFGYQIQEGRDQKNVYIPSRPTDPTISVLVLVMHLQSLVYEELKSCMTKMQILVQL